MNLLEDIAVTLSVAFLAGSLVQRTRVPTFVGYWLAGIVIAPFTPGYVGDAQTLFLDGGHHGVAKP